MDKEVREEACRQAALYRLLGCEKRLMILWLLCEREMAVSQLADDIGTSLQNVSQHLRLMKDFGILESRQEAQTVYYRLADSESSSRAVAATTLLTAQGTLPPHQRI